MWQLRRLCIAPAAALSACAGFGVPPNEDFLRHAINDVRETYRVPAIAVSTMTSERIEHQEIAGVRSLKEPNKATLDDYFHIGSCSKSVLALIAARMVQAGKISWNSGFFEVLPELEANADAGYHAITLEALLVGRAGITPFTSLEADPIPPYDGTPDAKRQQFVRYVLSLPPVATPVDGRFEHVYSNAGYTLATAMLERVSGLSYEALVDDIGRRLGVTFRIGWPSSYGGAQPWGHMIVDEAVTEFPPDHAYVFPDELTPAGNLSLTPKAFARYTQWHLRGLRGRDEVVDAEQWRHIHFAYDTQSLGAGSGEIEGKRATGFDGSAGTFFCRALIFPDDDYALTILMNAGSGEFQMPALEALTKKILVKQFNWTWKFWQWW